MFHAIPSYCISINGVGKVTAISAPGAGGEAGTGKAHTPLPALTEVNHQHMLTITYFHQ